MVKKKKSPVDAAVPKTFDPQSPSATRITRSLIDHVAGIAQTCSAAAIFVYVDALGGQSLALPANLEHKVFYVARTVAEEREHEVTGAMFLRVPNVPFTRFSQLKMAFFMALSRGLIKNEDIIVSLSGVPASGTLDTIVVTQVGREFEMFSVGEDGNLPEDVSHDVIERVVDLASELGYEGREGKPVGALFVLGDTERVTPLTRQLIMNPFRGYSAQERNILDPKLEETIKELTSIDGAFLISGDGVVETCGAYLKTASADEHELPNGLGARHHAASGITALTDSIAVAVSESTGAVTIFRGGRIVTEIEKPRSARTPK